jgi:GNAT superfamily N-acetyltransferase
MSSPKTLNRPEPLGAHHQVAAFDCGVLTLDGFLSCHALGNHQSGTAKTYVVSTDSHIVVGYYSLAASQILYADAPSRLQKGAPRHPIPAVLLARLAVDRSWQGKGIGEAVLRFTEGLGRRNYKGIISYCLHARENALQFYTKNGYTLVEKSYVLFDTIQHYYMKKSV